MSKALDVRHSSGKTPSAGAMKAKRLRKASSSKGVNKPTESPSRGNENINMNSVKAEVMWVSFVK